MTIEHDDCIKRGKIKPFARGVALAPKELETAKADLDTAKKPLKRAIINGRPYRSITRCSIARELCYI